MRSRYYSLLLSLLLACVAAAATGAGAYALYTHAINNEAEHLTDLARSQALLIGAVARFDLASPAYRNSEEAFAASASQIRAMRTQFRGFGETGELVLARQRQGLVEFLFEQRFSDPSNLLLPEGSESAAPMRRALNGESGTMRGLDYRGVEVIAAYEPIGVHAHGLVAKIDLAEGRRPFERMGLLSMGGSFALVLVVGLLFDRALAPRVRRLREKEQMFRTLFEFSPVGLMTATAAGQIHNINPRLCRTLGYSEVELRELGFSFIQSGVREHVLLRFKELSDGRLPSYSEILACTRKDQTPCLIQATVAPVDVAAGEEGLLLLVLQDVTATKNLERELEASLTRLRVAIQQAPFPIILHASDGEVLMLSAAWSDITGYAVADLPTIDTWLRLAFGEQGESVREVMERLYASGRSHEGEFTIRTASGAKRIWDFSSVSLPPLSDGRALVMSMAFDVTELRSLSQDLERSNQDLAEFAYVASHDLQEPLRTVASYMKLLEKRYSENLDEKTALYMHYVRDGAARMQAMIEGLLEYSRVGTRGGAFDSAPGSDILQAACNALGHAIEENGAKFEIGEMPEFYGDRAQLTRLFQNLFSNAIKYRSKERPPVVSVTAASEDGFYEIRVRDNGMGFPQEYASDIFQVFRRLESRREYPGTGIGLAVCTKIAERHGGSIRAESEVGVGSVFVIRLPRPPGESP